MVAHLAHNQKIAGSIPCSATNLVSDLEEVVHTHFEVESAK